MTEATAKKVTEPTMKASQARLQLALSYAVPIAGAAIATILGLILNDILGSKFNTWVWFTVLTVIGTSLILGTHAATKANNFVLKTNKQIGATVGARTAVFVLSIIWSVVSAFMSVGFVQDAVSRHRVYSEYPMKPTKEEEANWVPTVTIEPLTVERFINDYLPAFLILVLVLVGTIHWLLARAKEN